MSASAQRTAKQPRRIRDGWLIDKQQPLQFKFNGKCYAGYAGDTLASALIAAGVKLLGRSFKYHRPRGILTAGWDEPNALVELRAGTRREPNTRATTAELFDGLEAYSQNCWPSVEFDLGAVNSILSPFLAAGFYYKTFMWPAAFWEKIYEPAIRRAAGLGHASMQPDPDTYEKSHAFCDVLIVGAGPAGLAAALAAGRAGADVLLCDEDFQLGGRLNSDRRELDGVSGVAWVQQVEDELQSLPNVAILRRTCVFGVYDGSTYAAIERVADHLSVPEAHTPRQRYWKIVAKRTVLAAGALERPIVFGGNDLPGVMLASAVRTYLNRFGVVSGERSIVFTATDDGWTTAFDLAAAGIDVRAIVDPRSEVAPLLLKAGKRIGAQVMLGAEVIAAHGRRQLTSVSVRDQQGYVQRLQVDMLAVSAGWSPSVGLTTHLGKRPHWRKDIFAFVPSNDLRGMTTVGAMHGSYLLADALREGAAAGARAAKHTGCDVRLASAHKTDDESSACAAFWQVTEPRGKAFVDFQHDVTADDIALAVREGFNSPELLKRYTTLGMATDQGKTSNINGLAILASLSGRSISETGTTTFRPPYSPVALGALAGHHRGKEFRPVRYTAGHRWAQERGATFIEVGPWLRAQWFALPGETNWLQTVAREVKAVRSSVGVCDVSTLGKIDIQGSDVGNFLDRVYINTFSTLPVGKVRYGLMLREDGFVMDDGTSARLADDHYVMSTTTANAPKVMQHLEHARQVLWPELDVQIVSITEQWAIYAIAGPDSRRLLQNLLGDAIDLSNSAFPYMACAEFLWLGISVRLFRISFSGELAYEFAVPAQYGDAVIRAIMEAGAELGVTPYGTEALGVMRIEKGHAAGNELNGTTTAADLGLGRMMSKNKDCIGRVLASRPGLTDPARPTLVGIKPINVSFRLHAGAHFLARGVDAVAKNDSGYVTSVAFSPVLDHWVGLGLLSHGTQRVGERIRAYSALHRSDVEVEVVPPVFYDAEGGKLKA